MEKKKVLIVDDEMDMRIFMSALFDTSGFKAFTAKNGQEGVQKAAEIRPDLVLLDVMMPGEGGVTMYRELRTNETFRGVPVIMLSAVAEESFAHYLRMLNARLETPVPDPDAYLEKPPDPDQVLAVARNLIG